MADMIWSNALGEMVNKGFTMIKKGQKVHYTWSDTYCIYYNDEMEEDAFEDAFFDVPQGKKIILD